MDKKVIKNYIYNLGYQILTFILPLITTPYISRVLGAESIGTYSYTNSITQYFILFGCIGLNLYSQREIAYYQNDIEKRSKLFYELVILRFITLSISVLMFYFTLCQHGVYVYIFSIQIIDVIASMFDISWLYQGMEDFKRIVIRNILVKLSGLAIIFLFVKSPSDLAIYVLSYSLTLLIGNLSMWPHLPKFIKKVKINNLNITRHVKPTIVLFLPQVATSIYTTLDKTMIGLLTNNTSEVAYYEQSQKIIRIAMTLATSLGTVMLPRVANLFKEDKIEEVKESMYSSFKFISFLAFPICFGLMAVAKGLVPWFFGSGYDKVVLNMIIIAPIVFIIGFSNVIGTQFLLPTGRQKQYTISICAGTITNLVFNFLLIPSLLSYGAAIATVIAESAVTITQIYLTKNTFNYKHVLKIIYKYILSAIIMSVCVFMLSNYLSVSILSTFIEVIVGVIIYVIILILLKDDSLKIMISKIMKRG